ncbi:hypothetical protein ACHAW6_012993 [Cyclotella cf. meneghiniana]
MGRTASTDNTNTQPPQASKCGAKYICICIPQLQFRLQQNTISPHGLCSAIPYQVSKMKTFGEHSSNDWYLRTVPKHNRFHIMFVKATKSKQITDTVFFEH